MLGPWYGRVTYLLSGSFYFGWWKLSAQKTLGVWIWCPNWLQITSGLSPGAWKYCWWFRNPATNLNWLAGFLPSTVSTMSPWVLSRHSSLFERKNNESPSHVKVDSLRWETTRRVELVLDLFVCCCVFFGSFPTMAFITISIKHHHFSGKYVCWEPLFPSINTWSIHVLMETQSSVQNPSQRGLDHLDVPGS